MHKGEGEETDTTEDIVGYYLRDHCMILDDYLVRYLRVCAFKISKFELEPSTLTLLESSSLLYRKDANNGREPSDLDSSL